MVASWNLTWNPKNSIKNETGRRFFSWKNALNCHQVRSDEASEHHSLLLSGNSDEPRGVPGCGAADGQPPFFGPWNQRSYLSFSLWSIWHSYELWKPWPSMAHLFADDLHWVTYMKHIRTSDFPQQTLKLPLPLGPGSFASTAGVQRAGLVLREVLDRDIWNPTALPKYCFFWKDNLWIPVHASYSEWLLLSYSEWLLLRYSKFLYVLSKCICGVPSWCSQQTSFIYIHVHMLFGLWLEAVSVSKILSTGDWLSNCQAISTQLTQAMLDNVR